MQEKKLAELADEFSMSGKQANKLIANALPGGFSVVAIKKSLARLGLSVARQGGGAAGDDSDDAASDGDEQNNEAEEDEDEFNGDKVYDGAVDPLEDALGGDAHASKKATPKHRKRSKKLFDAIAKKQRAAAGSVPDDLLDDGEELADDLMDDDASTRDREALQSASDDELPGGASGSDQRKKELQKLAKHQHKPRADKLVGKGHKAPPARQNRSPKKALAAALGELVAEAQQESGGVCNLLFGARETHEHVPVYTCDTALHACRTVVQKLYRYTPAAASSLVDIQH